jgi:hypothetical protein
LTRGTARTHNGASFLLAASADQAAIRRYWRRSRFPVRQSSDAAALAVLLGEANVLTLEIADQLAENLRVRDNLNKRRGVFSREFSEQELVLNLLK